MPDAIYKIRSGDQWYQGARAGSWSGDEKSSPIFASRANAEKAIRKGTRNAQARADRFGSDLRSHLPDWKNAEVIEFTLTPT
jgi:hypothetical protein